LRIANEVSNPKGKTSIAHLQPLNELFVRIISQIGIKAKFYTSLAYILRLLFWSKKTGII